MAGKGIPHRYSIKRSNTLHERNIDEVALYFKELQTYAAAQPYLNPFLSIKALSPDAKASNATAKPESKRTSADEDEQKLKIEFNPKATRKPGQVLKLHVTYDEMKSKEGAKFGWIDPAKMPSKEEIKASKEEFKKTIASRPTAVFREYERGLDGNPTPRLLSEVRYKGLGQTIGQMQPEQRVGNAAAAALGVVFDAAGKMRCPPGTPNANQFTDENMSNCFVFSPLTVAREILRVGRRLAERLDGSGGATSRQDLRFDTAYDAEAFRKAERVKGVYTKAERMREKWGARTSAIENMFTKHGIDMDDSIGAANGDHIHALANEYSFSKIAKIYSDADPDFTFFDPSNGEEITDDIWNSFDSAKKAEVASYNAKRYDESLRQEITEMVPESIREAARNGDADAQKALDEYVERTREIHHKTQRGMLGSLLQYKDEMGDRQDAFGGFSSHGISGKDLVTTEAMALPNMDENGMPAVTITINPMSVAVRGRMPYEKNGSLFLEIESDVSLSEAEKQTEILRVMREITDAQEFVNLVGYANEQSAARGVADLGVSSEEMKGAHVMWHELGHVQQYNVARNKIYDFYDKNGFFPVVIDGKLEKLETPPAAWSNGTWASAMDSMMGATADRGGPFAKTGAMGFPPFGTDEFEDSFLHFVSGNYYQDKVQGALGVLGLPEEGAHRQLALMEGTTELFALEKLGVIEGPEVRQFTSWMDPVDPAPVPSLPPGAPPEVPDVPGPDVPEIPTAPPTTPSPPPGTTIIDNSTTINIVINGPINIHVGGTAPDWDEGAIEPPIPPRKTVDLKWEDITPMILADKDSQWTASPSSGADIGQNKDMQKLWLDSVFGMGPEEGGFVPEQGELPRIDKDAYWKLSPQQMDTRYEFLRGEADALILKSETESLNKDEQAKLWLATKGMQQILDMNGKKAALADAKREEYLRDGFDPTPGKYLRQVDSPLKPQQKGFRKLATKRAEERGYDVVEIDDDELSHWAREISDHAGTASDSGADAFSGADRPYKRGEVRNNPSFNTKKNLERNPNYEPSNEPPTPDTDSAGYVGSKLDEIKSRSTPEQRAILDSSETVEKRESVEALMDSSDPSKLSGMLSRSAEKRQAAKTGGEIKRSTPSESGDIIDDDFESGVVPFLDLIETSKFDDDVKLVTSMQIPKNGISDGDTIDHTKIMRGKVVDFDTSDGFDFSQPEANRRVVIEMPKGSRGVPSKNAHNGDTDDYLLPPGSLSVVRVDPDGTIFATPLEQHGKKEILDDMEKNLNGIELGADSLEELERRTLLSSISKERSKVVPEKRTTRGLSSSGPRAARQSARNQAIVDGFDKNGSSIYGTDTRIGMSPETLARMEGESNDKFRKALGLDRSVEIPKRDQRVESSVAKLGGLLSGKAEPSNQEEFEFVNSLSPELKDLFTSLDASEIKSIVDDELFDYHQQFDDRVRISLHPEEFKEFLKTGKLKNITETKPNSASASMLKEFEGKLGMSENLPDGARSHSGFMVHKTHTDEIADYLNELPGNGISRNPHFFSETDDVNPSGKSRAGGKVIDLVLAPEVAQRAVYGRGDVTGGEVLPTPVLSTNRAEVGSAFVNLSDVSESSELDGMKQIAEVLESSITGNKTGLGGGHGVPTSVKSRNPGFAHEALVAGGVTIADAEQIRIPVEALDMEDVTVSFDGVELDNVRQQLSQAGLTNSEIDDVIDKIGAGIAPYALPEIERMRQGMASEKMSEELSLVPNHSMTLVPTNPDGVDVLNPDPLPGEPTTNKEMRDAWRKRYAVESQLKSIKDLAKHEKETKGKIEPRMSAKSPSGESRVSQRRQGIRYSEDGYKSIYENGIDDFVSEAVDTVEYNPKTRELRVLFKGQSDPYHFLDVDPDDLEDFGDEFEPIGNKIDRIKRTNNRTVRGPDGSVIRWDGKEWSYEDAGMSSKKPSVPFDGDISDKTPDDIAFDSDIDEIISPSSTSRIGMFIPQERATDSDIFDTDEIKKRIEGMSARLGEMNPRDMDRRKPRVDENGRPQQLLGAGMASRRDSKLAESDKPKKFGFGKKSKIKQGVESDDERRKRILEMSKGDPRTSPGVRKANYQTYDGKDVYAVDNMDDAIALLVAGHHVDLSDSHDEGDLWGEFKSFKKWLKGVDKAAAKKMSFNLCSVHKEGANIFCGKHKGIIRDDMPQVGGTVTDPNAPAIRLWVGGHVHGNSFDSYNGANTPDWVKQGLLSEQTDPELFKRAKAESDRLENVYRALGSRYYPGNTVDPLTEAEKQEFFSLTDIRKVEPDMIDNFVDVLRANGVNVSEPEDRDPMTLRATQNELVAGTVLGLSDAITSYEDMLQIGQRPDGTPFTQQDYDRVRMLGPILVTKDGYILDGHHRVFGKVAANFDREDNDQLAQKVRVVDMPLEALLSFTRAYGEHIGIAAASGQSTERRTLPDDIKTPLDIIPAAAGDLEKLNAEFTDNLDDKVKALEERDGHPFFKPESPGFEQGESYRQSMQFVERRVLTDKQPGERSSPSRVPSSGGMASRRSGITTPGGRDSVGANRVDTSSAVQPNARKMHEDAVSKTMDALDGVNLDGLSESELQSRFGVARSGEKSLIDSRDIYHTTDGATAIAMLARGYNVEVDNDGLAAEVSDSQAAFRKMIEANVKKLENLSADERNALLDELTVDLCKLYVAGKNVMCGENIGIDREQMPQLSGRTLGDDTLAMRAAKDGHIPMKWAAIDEKNLPPEELARFKELEAKHVAPGRDETFGPGEKEEFYSLVDWNNSEADVVKEFEKSLESSLKPVDKDGNPTSAVILKTARPESYKASQRQLVGHKTDEMRDGIRENLTKFDSHAESLGLKKGTPEYKEMRAKWLAGEYKFADSNGVKVKAWWTDPLLATRDGYVLDGHHRWAAIKLINDELPEDEKLSLRWKEVQTNVVEALTLGKAFQDKWGIKEAKLKGERQFVKNDEVPGIELGEIVKEMDEYHSKLTDTLDELHSNNQFIRKQYLGARKNPKVAAAQVEAGKRGEEWAARQSGVSGGKVRVPREKLEEIRGGKLEEVSGEPQGMRSLSRPYRDTSDEELKTQYDKYLRYLGGPGDKGDGDLTYMRRAKEFDKIKKEVARRREDAGVDGGGRGSLLRPYRNTSDEELKAIYEKYLRYLGGPGDKGDSDFTYMRRSKEFDKIKKEVARREEYAKKPSRGMRSSVGKNVRVRAGEGGVPEKVSSGQPDTPEVKTPPKIERTHKGVDIPEFIDEMPAEGQYSDEVVEKAVELHDKVKKVEPELTDNLIDMAAEGGGEMEGLEFRFKATKGNAKKITNISRDSGISVEEAQLQVPDAVRYTMTFPEEEYVGGAENVISRLEGIGHEVQVKNYWDEGDGYQGINIVVKHPDGFLYELQLHTPESFKVKQAAHDAYDEYQKEKDDVIRLELFRRMAAAAGELPMPKGDVKGIGNLARKNFQTWAQQQGGK